MDHKEDCAGFKDDKHKLAGVCESFCWGHMACEPLPADNSHYQVCGECFHVFVSADELLTMHNEKSKEAYDKWASDPVFGVVGKPQPFQPETDVNNVYFCPVCVHDF